MILVGNKADLTNGRMVLEADGKRLCDATGCACFHEVSAREDIEAIRAVFRDACRFLRFTAKFPKLMRTRSESMRLSMTIHSDENNLSADQILSLCCDSPIIKNHQQDEKKNQNILLRSWRARSWWTQGRKAENNDEVRPLAGERELEPFRSRAKTDGNIIDLKRKCRNTSTCASTSRP